ncbi:hypothetical protein R6Z07M_018117 [Ovis aries]
MQRVPVDRGADWTGPPGPGQGRGSGHHSCEQSPGALFLNDSIEKVVFVGTVSPSVVAHWFSCTVAYGIFPDVESNLCPMHWQADSIPLDHQELADALAYCHEKK